MTFSDRVFIDLGGKRIELIYTGKNHSDNSLVVLLPQDRLLFAVDFIPVETVAYRALPDAYPDEWIDSLKRVEGLEFDTLVPATARSAGRSMCISFASIWRTSEPPCWSR